MNKTEERLKNPKLQNPKIQDKQSENTIDLIELFYALVARWHMLLVCGLIGALLFNAYSFFVVTPTYKSTAKLYVVSSSGDSAVDLTDLNIGTSLTNDYRELIMSYPVLDRVIASMKLDMTSESLSRIVSLTNPANTRVLEITVSHADPQMAYEIANTIAGIAQEYLPETMSTVRPNIAQVAKIATKKSSPSYPRDTMLGFLLGLVLMGAWIVSRVIMDDTIHNEEEWEKNFDIPLLTVVAEFESNESGRSTGKRKKLKGRRVSDSKRKGGSRR